MFRIPLRYHLHVSRKMVLFMDSVIFGIKLRTSHTAINHFYPLFAARRTCSSNLSNTDSYTGTALKEMPENTGNHLTEILFSLFEQERAIHQALSISSGSDSGGLLSHRKKRIHNFLCADFRKLIAHQPELGKNVQCLEDNINGLPSKHYPEILECFTNLLVPCDSQFMTKLVGMCVDQIETFDIHGLSLVAQHAFMTENTSVSSQVAQSLHSRLELDKIPLTTSTSDLSLLFRCVCPFMGQRALDLSIQFVMQYIAHRPILDFSSIRLLCELAEGSSREATEKIQEKILQSNVLSLDTALDLQEVDLDACSVIGRHLDSLFSHTSLLSKIRRLCCSDSSDKESKLTPLEAHKVAFFLPQRLRTLTLNVTGTELQQTKIFDVCKTVFDLLSAGIKDADSHGLFMYLKLFSQTNLPWRTVSELQDRLVRVFGERSVEEQQDLFDQDGELELLLYSFVINITNSGLDVAPELVKLVSSRFNPGKGVCPVPTSKVSLLVHWLTSGLFNNHAISLRKKNLIASLFSQMQISSLTLLGVQLEMKSKLRQIGNVKSQVGFLTGRARLCLNEKLASLQRLPASCLSHDFDDVWAIPEVMSSRHLDNVMSIITHLTLDKDADVSTCLRAIEFLSVGAHQLNLCQPMLYEKLLQFVHSQDSLPIHAFLTLVQVFSWTSYRPYDFDAFTSFCLSFQEEARQRNLLSLTQQVQLAYYLSTFNIFDKEVVTAIFSPNFLSTLSAEFEELETLHGQGTEFCRSCLYLLNRSAVIECPSLSLQLVTSPPEKTTHVPGVPDLFFESIGRIFQNSPFIQQHAVSSYGHRIDALVCLDDNGEVVDTVNADMEDCFRLAFMYLSSHDLCYKTKYQPSGDMQALKRQLKLLGYFVVEVSFRRLYAMEMNTNEAVDNLFREQIIHAIGPRFLFK